MDLTATSNLTFNAFICDSSCTVRVVKKFPSEIIPVSVLILKLYVNIKSGSFYMHNIPGHYILLTFLLSLQLIQLRKV